MPTKEERRLYYEKHKDKIKEQRKILYEKKKEELNRKRRENNWKTRENNLKNPNYKKTKRISGWKRQGII